LAFNPEMRILTPFMSATDAMRLLPMNSNAGRKVGARYLMFQRSAISFTINGCLITAS
jgi:hypothetical protein